jgi:integrase
MDTETTPQTEVITVNQILDRYERDCLHLLAPGTVKGYRYHIRDLRRAFGSAIASELRPKDFGEFLNVRRGKVHRVRQLAVLSAAFTQAVSFWYVLPANILRDVKRPKAKPRDRLVSDAEFKGLAAQVPQRIRLAMMLAALTGQRQGDIIRFRWANLRDNALNIQQGKTKKRLAIEITKDLEDVLDQCWLLPAGGHAGSEYILPNMYGRSYVPEGFRACWQKEMNKWVRRGNARFTFHDLRALAATRCATPEIAMRLLGHSNISMTLRVYRRGVERVSALTV